MVDSLLASWENDDITIDHICALLIHSNESFWDTMLMKQRSGSKWTIHGAWDSVATACLVCLGTLVSTSARNFFLYHIDYKPDLPHFGKVVVDNMVIYPYGRTKMGFTSMRQDLGCLPLSIPKILKSIFPLATFNSHSFDAKRLDRV